MKKSVLTLVLALGFLGVRNASAATYVNYQLHGNSCVSTTAGATPTYGRYGPYAPGSTAINVTCPLVLPSIGNYQYAYILVTGYGRSTPDKLSCTISSTAYDGGGLYSATATLPNNSPYVQSWSAAIYPPSSSPWLYLSCHIPAATAQGVSHISNIWMQVGY